MLLWKIERKLRKIAIAHSADPRPASFPFISGDGFRKLADHIYESGRENPDGEGRVFDPAAVRQGDIVFVEAEILDRYFKETHPKIRNPYKLVTHNGDRNIGREELRCVDDKIIRWFAQNVLAEHQRLTPIPIGLENMHYWNHGVPRMFRRFKATPIKRSDRILFGFNVRSNPVARQEALDILSKNRTADLLSDWPNQAEYLKKLSSYTFVASPPGNGEDCIRTWEAMLVGTVPIVKRSACMEYFKGLGLPLLIVDSWEELPGLTEYDLKSKYDLITSTANLKPLYMDYWMDLILEKQPKT